jgi:hypothetical protein
MELVLNLFWLLLALPAYWIWRRQDRKLDSLHRFLALASVLVLLFPVVSATDDLHAMRQETEESSSTKRALKHATIEKSSAQTQFHTPPADVTFTFAVRLSRCLCGSATFEPSSIPDGAEFHRLPSRAPPILLLA